MFYQRYTEQSDNDKWGGATYFFETDDLGIPVRQLGVYQNGEVTKYDTAHPSDKNGKLSQTPLFTDSADKKEWRRYRIGKRAFEKAWKKPDLVPSDPFADAIKSVRTAGLWTIVLGTCTAAIGVVLALIAHGSGTLSDSNQSNFFALYIAFLVIPGMTLNTVGILLRSTGAESLLLAQKLMIIANVLIFGVPLLALFVGGGGAAGVLGLTDFVLLQRAMRKIWRLGAWPSVQYRLGVLGIFIVVLLIGGLTLPHLKTQLDVNDAAVAQPKPAKRLVSTSAAKDLATANSLAEAEQDLQKFGAQYNVKIEVTDVAASANFQSDSYSQLAEDGFDLPELKSFGAVFIDEWSKYPTDWVRHSKLQSIKLVKDLKINKVATPASADPTAEALYFDVSFLNGAYITNATVTRQLVHETYFSLITHNDFGSYTPADPAWQTLNTPGFSYGSSAYCKQTEHTDDCMGREHPMAGFVNDHATTSLQEDKSQLYGYLMTTASFHDLEKWADKDKQLTNKTQALVGYISKYSPEMKGDYYTDINP